MPQTDTFDGLCSAAVCLLMVSLASELAIAAITLITMLSRSQASASSILFLAASLCVTLIMATYNIMESKRLLNLLSLNRVRDVIRDSCLQDSGSTSAINGQCPSVSAALRSAS